MSESERRRRVALLLPTAGTGEHPALVGRPELAGIQVVSLGSILRVGAADSEAVDALEDSLHEAGVTHLIAFSGAARIALSGLHVAFDQTLVVGGDGIPLVLEAADHVRFVYGTADPVFARNATALSRAGRVQRLEGCDHSLSSYVATGVISAFVDEVTRTD